MDDEVERETLPLGWVEAVDDDGRKIWVDNYNRTTSLVHPNDIFAAAEPSSDNDGYKWINEVAGRKGISYPSDGVNDSPNGVFVYGSSGSLWTTREQRCTEYITNGHNSTAGWADAEPYNLLVVSEKPPPAIFSASVTRTLAASESLAAAQQAFEAAEAQQRSTYTHIESNLQRIAQQEENVRKNCEPLHVNKILAPLEEERVRMVAEQRIVDGALCAAQASVTAALESGDQASSQLHSLLSVLTGCGLQAGLYAYQDSGTWAKFVLEGRECGVRLVLADQQQGEPFVRSQMKLPAHTKVDLCMSARGEAYYRLDDSGGWVRVLREGGWVAPNEIGGVEWPEFVSLDMNDERSRVPAVAVLPRQWCAVLGSEQWSGTSGIVTFTNIGCIAI